MSIREKGDELFKKDVEKGLSIRELSEKYGIGKRQVSRRKAKLGEKVFLREVMSPYPQATPPTSTQRMTFWLAPAQIKWIKQRAVVERRTASAILREILEEQLKPGKKQRQRGLKSET